MSSGNELWEILVPTLRDGRPVRIRHHRVWDDHVRRLSGGLTILKPAKGNWINPVCGTLFVERVIPVRIRCSEVEIHEIIRFTKTHYSQIKVMAYRISDFVIIE